GEHGRRQTEEEATRREHALPQDGTDRRAGEAGRERADGGADHPTQRASPEPDDPALGSGQERALPTPRAVPRETSPGRGEVTPEGPRREHGERHEERGRLATHEQQASSGDRRVLLRGAELL